MSNRNKNHGRQQEGPKADPTPPQAAAATAPPVDPAAAAITEPVVQTTTAPPTEPVTAPPKLRHEYPLALQHCGYPVDALNAQKKVWCHGCHREYWPEKLEAWKPATKQA